MENPYDHWRPEEATLESDGKPDSAIVPYIESLRKQGIVTYSSCGGHPSEIRGDEKWGFIQFEDLDLDIGIIDENSEDFSEIIRIYPGPVWDIRFRGMTESEECLRKNMEVVFEAVGAEFPQEV